MRKRSYIRYTGAGKMIDGWFGGIAPGTINHIVINYGDAVVQLTTSTHCLEVLVWQVFQRLYSNDEDAVLGYGAENPFAKQA